MEFYFDLSLWAAKTNIQRELSSPIHKQMNLVSEFFLANHFSKFKTYF